MRKHLEEDFDAVYVLDLGGNRRKGLKVSDANVFGIQVGVSISLFVKTKQNPSESAASFTIAQTTYGIKIKIRFHERAQTYRQYRVANDSTGRRAYLADGGAAP